MDRGSGGLVQLEVVWCLSTDMEAQHHDKDFGGLIWYDWETALTVWILNFSFLCFLLFSLFLDPFLLLFCMVIFASRVDQRVATFRLSLSQDYRYPLSTHANRILHLR